MKAETAEAIRKAREFLHKLDTVGMAVPRDAELFDAMIDARRALLDLADAPPQVPDDRVMLTAIADGFATLKGVPEFRRLAKITVDAINTELARHAKEGK